MAGVHFGLTFLEGGGKFRSALAKSFWLSLLVTCLEKMCDVYRDLGRKAKEWADPGIAPFPADQYLLRYWRDADGPGLREEADCLAAEGPCGVGVATVPYGRVEA